MESQKLGQSQFSEQVTYQRALEGELARTIKGRDQRGRKTMNRHALPPKQLGEVWNKTVSK